MGFITIRRLFKDKHMSETILYTHIQLPDCEYCHKAKDLFEKHNIEFEIQTVGQDLKPRDLYNKIGPYRVFPQIIYEGEYLPKGYSDLVEKLGEEQVS